MTQLGGVHHVTAITSSAIKIYDFFTNILSLRLVKKTVNQDDIHTYHLFFADDAGSAGTDMTFFDFRGIPKRGRGTNEISTTGFRVKDDASLEYWKKRFTKYNVKHEDITELFGKKVLRFEDFDSQRYILFSDELNTGVESGTPWLKGPVPNEFAITGLGPIFLTVNKVDSMHNLLTSVFLMKKIDTNGTHTLYEMGLGGNGASVIVVDDKSFTRATQGYGGVHHVAFRVKDREELDSWTRRLNSLGAPNSGYVDRFYFESLYTRLYDGFLFEIATDGPGFLDDQETYENLGETLALPPKLRGNQAIINSIKTFDTVRSTKVFEKEYLDE